MAANPIPESLSQLFALAEDAADGAKDHGAAIDLKQNTEAAIRADLAAARAAESDYGKAKAAKDTFATNLRIADSNGRAFIKAASALFSQTISESWTAAWEGTGFPNQSTAVPGTQDERFTLLASLKKYFTDNPTAEVNTPKLVITAAKADTLFIALSDARKAVNDGNTASGTQRDARDVVVSKLKDRMRGLIGELGQLIADTSPVWDAFGLNQPGASSTPEIPEALVVTLGTPGVLHVDWADARRATRYRVWKQLDGVDAAPVAVATVTDSNATLTGLPSGKPLKISVTAANEAGESPASDVVTVTVP
jgi:hypothetical protein